MMNDVIDVEDVADLLMKVVDICFIDRYGDTGINVSHIFSGYALALGMSLAMLMEPPKNGYPDEIIDVIVMTIKKGYDWQTNEQSE